VRRREQDLQKVKKEIELINVQHEANEQTLKKRHQEQLNDLSEQLERSNKQKSKYGSHSGGRRVGGAPRQHFWGGPRRGSKMTCTYEQYEPLMSQEVRIISILHRRISNA